MPFIIDQKILILSGIILLLQIPISFFLSFLFKKISEKYNILDSSQSNPERKSQKKAVPLMGGTGFILSSLFFIGVVWLIRKDYINFLNLNFFENLNAILGRNLETFKLFWIFVAIIIILIGGYLDDKFKFKSKIIFLPTALAIFIAVYFGNLKIDVLSEPFNLFLPQNEFFQYLVAYVWIGLCLSATKFLDGHDGLVSIVGIVTFSAIGIIALSPQVNQPLIFLFSLILISGIIGFLPWNWPEAKLYLGEGGAQAIGFMIGVLSIISGAKIATSSTVIGWFIYDILFVMFLRVLNKRNPLEGDRLHWHFRLLDAGLSKIQVLLCTFFVIVITAYLGITLNTYEKLYLLIGQGLFLLLIFFITSKIAKKRLASKF